MNQIKKEELIREMINKQLAFVNKTIEDVKDDPEWFTHYSLTEAQFIEWKEFCLDTMKKKFKFNKTRAEMEFGWFNLNYGLKVEGDNLL